MQYLQITELGKNGFILSADATGARATANANVAKILNANATVNGPQAGGTVALYNSEEKTQIGFSGKVTEGSASANINLGFGNATYKPDAAEKPNRLFNIGAGVKADGGADATLMYTREKIMDINDRISVHSNKIEIGASLGLGFSLNVTVPSVQFKLW